VSEPLRLGVLVSGTGTNLQTLLDACRSGALPAEIAVAVSNVPEAFALERARSQGVPAVVVDHRAFASRSAFETALQKTLDSFRVDLVCLAGFLRILSPGFVAAFSCRPLAGRGCTARRCIKRCWHPEPA